MTPPRHSTSSTNQPQPLIKARWRFAFASFVWIVSVLDLADVSSPCLSFDIRRDSFGENREPFPKTAYVVAGTQADQAKKNKIFVIKVCSPCLSFDIRRDSFGENREPFPKTAYVVAGTQADQAKKNKIFVIKVCSPCLSFDIRRDSFGENREPFPKTAYVVAGTQADQAKKNKIFVIKALKFSEAAILAKSPYSSDEYVKICLKLGLKPTNEAKNRIRKVLQRSSTSTPPVKPNTVKNSHADSPTPVKPNTVKNSHADSPTPVKPNTVKNSHSDSPTPVKPNTVKNSHSDSPTPVKPNTVKNSHSDSPTPVKPNTVKNSHSDSPTPVKPNTVKNSHSDSPTPVKPNTVKNIDSSSPTPVKLNTVKNIDSSSTTPVKPNTAKNSHSSSATGVKTNTPLNSVLLPDVSDDSVPSPTVEKILGDNVPDPITKPADGSGDVSSLPFEALSEDLPHAANHHKPHNSARPSTRTVCDNFLGSCIINEKNWSMIWGGSKLLPRKYGYGLSESVKVVEAACVIICDRHYMWNSDSNTKITVLAHCNHKGCRRFRLVITVNDGSDSKPTLDVYCDQVEKRHGVTPEWRPLNGPHRKELYEIAQYAKPLDLREKMIHKADETALSQGNAQEIRPLGTYAKLAHEARGQDDLHSDPFLSAISMRREQVKKTYQGIQYIWVVQDPLAVYIYCLNRLHLFKRAKALLSKKSESVGVTLHLDATGSVVRKVCLSDHVVYYYSIVFKFTAPNENHIVPLAELVSSNHDAVSISNWLSSFRYFAESNHVSLGGHFIVLDISYAELNAVVLAFNGMRLWFFLQMIHSFVIKGISDEWVMGCLSKFVIPHLDYAHFKKAIGQSIKNHYYPSPKVRTNDPPPPSDAPNNREDSKSQCNSNKQETPTNPVDAFKKEVSRLKKKDNLSKDDYKFVKSIIMDIFTLIVHTSSYSDMKNIFQHLFTLLLFSVVCPLVNESKKKLYGYCSKSPEVEKSKTSEAKETEKSDDQPLFFNVEEDKIKYKKNPFYLDFEKIFSDILKSHDDFLSKKSKSNLDKNIFFNPSFAIYILTYYTHIVPLWTALLLPEGVKLNNGLIETFFNIVKNIFLAGRRNIRIDRFLRKDNDHVVAVKKQVDNHVPDRRPRQQSKNRKRQSKGDDNEHHGAPLKKKRDADHVFLEEDADEPAECEWMPLEKEADGEAPSSAYSLQTVEKWSRKGTMPVTPVGSATQKYSHIRKFFSVKSEPKESTSNGESTPVQQVNVEVSGQGDTVLTDQPEPSGVSLPAHSLEMQEGSDRSNTVNLDLSRGEGKAAEIDNDDDDTGVEVLSPLPQAEMVKLARSRRRKIVERNLTFRNTLRNLQGFNFATVISLLKETKCTFREYLKSVLCKQGTILDIDYYSSVISVPNRLKERPRNLNYLVTRNYCVPDFEAPLLLGHESFSVLADKGRPTDLYLTSEIIHAAIQLFISKYDIDETKVLFLRTETGSFIFNDDLPPELIADVPPTTEVMIMPYCKGQKIHVPEQDQTKGDHWCMVVVNFKTAEFYHLDPLIGATGYSYLQLVMFQKFLELTGNNRLSSLDWSYPAWTFPQQIDNYNCGVYIVFYISMVLKNYPVSPSFPPGQLFCPSEYRKVLRYILLAASSDVFNYCLSCLGEYESDVGKRDTWWISCDFCSRYVHISSECLNDTTLNPSVMIEKARNQKKLAYICYLCKKNNKSFKAIQKIKQLEHLQKILDKYNFL
ncbi:unnamed protein product [Bemisia tabaci]|uniref:Ubiquitin-like protease family profile domain-containing protein n=1 Tax=Bemisia tabaci TaxID=7038 RepID=A0A9P0AJ44_BEMTA|nr:unnamed protein product [Bemisia tabaci]